MTIDILVKNHKEVDIERLDKHIFNGIPRNHFELQEMEEGYEFKYEGKWREVVAVCLHNMLVTIKRVCDEDGSITEETVPFLLNLRCKD